jgi:Putative peptidoglycan binding domain/D-alanyl-D-alanine carboxypeptidase
MNLNQLVAIPATINVGLSSARQNTMLSVLGNPRGDYDQNCREITNPKLKPLVAGRDFGAFKARGLKPALDSLSLVMADIQATKPDVFGALGTMGMLCVRNQRGSTTAISNHSWGTAIDLTINEVLDVRGDRKVQRGLIEIFEIFNHHGWYWGAAFGVEDGMHFEVSEGLIREWMSSAPIVTGRPVPKIVLTLGDRGPEVKLLQQRLNAIGGASISADGVFGHGTFVAVVAFQASVGLTADGAVGEKTWAALA